MDLIDGVKDFVGEGLSIAEPIGDVMGDLAPVVGAFNPALGFAMNAFSSGADWAEKFGMDQVRQDKTDDCFENKRGKGKGECDGASEGGSRGFFFDVARALSKTIQKTADELVEKSKELQASADSEDKKNFFILSGDTNALGAMMKNGSELLASVMNNAKDAQSAVVKRG